MPTYTLYYTFDSCIDYPYDVEYSVQDITEYEYERHFAKKWNDLNWYLEPGSKELVDEINSKWFTNTLDMSSYYSFNFDYREWLKDHYRLSAELKYEKECELEEFDECITYMECFNE